MLERLIQEVRRWEKSFGSSRAKTRLGGLSEPYWRKSTRNGRASRGYLKTDEFYEWLDEQTEAEAMDIESESTNCTLQPA